MELNKLDKLIREVKLMLSKDDTPEMVRLLYDLEEAPYSYKKQYETLDGIQLAAFDHALWQRIAAFPKLVEKGDKAAAAMREFKIELVRTGESRKAHDLLRADPSRAYLPGESDCGKSRHQGLAGYRRKSN